MLIIDEETGDMITRQGDSFNFTVEGVDDSYDLYYSIYKNVTREIVFELQTKPIDGVAVFNVSPALSNLLTVPDGRKTEKYFYGIKRCKDGEEDTLLVGNKEIQDLNKLTVYPLITEGAENGAS